MCKSPKLKNLNSALKFVLWFVSRSKLLQSNCWLLLLLFTLAHVDHGGLVSAGSVDRFKFTLIKAKYPAERLRFSIMLIKYVTLGQELPSIWQAQSMGLGRISVVCGNPCGHTQKFLRGYEIDIWQKYSPISKIHPPELTIIEFMEVLKDKGKGQLVIMYTDFFFFFWPWIRLIFTAQGRAWPIWKHLCYANSSEMVEWQVTDCVLELFHVE